MPARAPGQTLRSSTPPSHDPEPALGRSEWGLATYTHDRDGRRASRSFQFQDEGIRSFTFDSAHSHYRYQDQQSSCTSFEGLNDPAASGHIVHSVKGTQIDQSEVYNGDISRTPDLSVRREHNLECGSIKNRSKVANGDLNIDAFVAFYCRQPEPTMEYRAERRSAHRAGPRRGSTPRRQSRK